MMRAYDYEVAVMIPVYKTEPETFEKFAFKHNLKKLKRHPIYIVTHDSVDISYYERVMFELNIIYTVEYQDVKYLMSVDGYNKLLMTVGFYKRFKSFRYLLICQLDAYIFGDNLEYWCDKNYDYIGAPWIIRKGKSYIMDGVGNGGLSLRKVSTHLRALQTFSYIISPIALAREYFLVKRPLKRYCRLAAKWLLQITLRNNTNEHFNDFKENEDIFWGKVVSKNFVWFNVAPVEEAMQFSMELEPRYLYELNNNKLPFGCHAWEKYDPEFWSAHIKEEHLTD